jgi:mannitol-specific phosphotransferase system IIBC component
MIAASGGLDEVFLPFIVVVPGTCCAILGGAIGKALAVVYSASANTKSA